MEPTAEHAAKLDRARRDAVEAMTFEQRAAMPLMLFDLVAESIRVGIRMQHPHASPDEVHRLFIQRLQDWKRGERRR